MLKYYWRNVGENEYAFGERIFVILRRMWEKKTSWLLGW